MSKHSSCPKARMLTAILIISLTGACANGPSARPGDAPVAADTAVMWEDGLKAVDTGEAMLTKGEKRLELGRQQVREGQAKIAEANTRVSQAKLDYERTAAAMPATADKQGQANALRAIGVRWEAALQDIKDGNKLIEKGNANMNLGESEIRDGRRLMETGSVLMRNAHRSRLGQPLLPLPTG